jgi:hypothetical protein
MLSRLAIPSSKRLSSSFGQKVYFFSTANLADHQRLSVNSLLDSYIENTDIYAEAFEDNFSELTESIKRNRYLDKQEEVSATKLI